MYELQIPAKILKEVKRSGNKALVAKLKSLTHNPLAYGEPLKGNLHGYYKAKVPPYRFIYQVDEDQKLVIIVSLRTRDKVNP